MLGERYDDMLRAVLLQAREESILHEMVWELNTIDPSGFWRLLDRRF